jgi:hypothetical protein
MGMEGEGGKGKGALPRRRGGGGGRRRCGTPFAGVLTAAAAAAARGERKGHTRDLIWVWSFLFSSGCKSLSPPPLLGFSDLRKGRWPRAIMRSGIRMGWARALWSLRLLRSASGPTCQWGGGTLPFRYLFFVSLGGDGDFLPTSRRCHVSVFLFFQLPLVSFNLFDP